MFFPGFWFLLPLLFIGKFFWIVILALLIMAIVRRFSWRNRYWQPYQGPTYTPGMRPNTGMPPVQPSAMEILRQRYARGEIDAVTFDQMRERLESSGEASQQ
jgi:putative membrane protein